MPRPKKGVSKDGLKLLGNERGKLKYEARVTVQHDGARRSKERVIFAENLRDAERQRDALQEELRAEIVASGQGPAAPIEGVATLLDAWLETLRHATGITYRTYTRHLAKAFGTRTAESLTTQELQAFLSALALSDHTVNCMRAAYCTCFKWAKKEGRISEAAMRTMLATDRRKRTLTDEELLESVEEMPASRAMTHDEIVVFMRTFEQVDPEAYLIFGTQFLLGCRFGEAIAIHWSSVEETTGRVIVRHNFTRGRLSVPKGKKARITALAPRWLAKLQEHRRRLLQEQRPMADRLVFPVPATHLERRNQERGLKEIEYHFYHYRDLYQRFVAVKDACGITLAPRTATHAMRHTLVSLVRSESQDVVASRLFGVPAGRSERDVDLSRRIGHTTGAMTEHYTSVPAGKLIDLSVEAEQLLHGPRSAASGRPGEPDPDEE